MLFVIGGIAQSMARENPPFGEGSKKGGWRLATSESLYLREACQQPVEWRPWGEEAFSEAQRLRRPILLDIGAAWCHWCHVMDETTYSDPEVARLINEFFIPVKVDRDENPEVDRRYQQEVAALSGEGGWPLTAFLAPTGEAFLGGTYFPPRDSAGRPGMVRILRDISRQWREDPRSLRDNIEAVRRALRREVPVRPPSGSLSMAEFEGHVLEGLLASYDPVHGGFGMAPKFPHPVAVEFLLAEGVAGPHPPASEAAVHTLRTMAEGGLFDQLGGGFHRYCVEESWRIPHFEKMGIDNAYLLEAYLQGYAFSREPLFAEVARKTAEYILNELFVSDPPAFAASQDADNAPGDDGSFYTWTRAQLKEILTEEEYRAVRWRYGLGTEGRMPGDPERNVLFRLSSLEDVARALGRSVEDTEALLGRALDKMRAARGDRPRPGVDRNRYAGINGALISSMTQAGRMFGDPRYLAAARQAADSFLKGAWDPSKGVAHHLSAGGGRGWGYLEDQVLFATGLLHLAEGTQEPRYLSVAGQLLELVRTHYRQGPEEPLRDLSPDLYDGLKVAGLTEPGYTLEDMPHCSPNAIAALAWIRYANLSEDPKGLEEAQRTIKAAIPRVRSHGLFVSGLALAARSLQSTPLRIVLEDVTSPKDPLAAMALTTYHPRKVVFLGAPPPPFSLPIERTGSSKETSGTRALVCLESSCLPPVESADDLRGLIERYSRSKTEA
jgi:uncharacterized protein YyaL (SSP411 family)